MLSVCSRVFNVVVPEKTGISFRANHPLGQKKIEWNRIWCCTWKVENFSTRCKAGTSRLSSWRMRYLALFFQHNYMSSEQICRRSQKTKPSQWKCLLPLCKVLQASISSEWELRLGESWCRSIKCQQVEHTCFLHKACCRSLPCRLWWSCGPSSGAEGAGPRIEEQTWRQWQGGVGEGWSQYEFLRSWAKICVPRVPICFGLHRYNPGAIGLGHVDPISYITGICGGIAEMGDRVVRQQGTYVPLDLDIRRTVRRKFFSTSSLRFLTLYKTFSNFHCLISHLQTDALLLWSCRCRVSSMSSCTKAAGPKTSLHQARRLVVDSFGGQQTGNGLMFQETPHDFPGMVY